MKRSYLYLMAVLGILALAGCSSNKFNNSNASEPRAKIEAVKIDADHATDRIVVFYDNPSALDELLSNLGGGKVIDKLPALNAALVELPDGLDASHALGKLSSTKINGIRLAQPDFLHPRPEPVNNGAIQELSLNDPLEAQKWDHDVMQAADAWATDVDGAGTHPDGSGCLHYVVIPLLRFKRVIEREFLDGAAVDWFGAGVQEVGLRQSYAVYFRTTQFPERVRGVEAVGQLDQGGV